MVDPHVGHETSDLAGSSKGFQGSVTDNYVDTQLKLSPERVISEFLIECPDGSDGNLEVSIDGTNLFKTICPGAHFAWTPKGLTQKILYLKRASGSSVSYEAVLNFEDF